MQTQGGWTTAKVLLDTYSHFMPLEMHGFADALPAGNGTPAAPARIGAASPPRSLFDRIPTYRTSRKCSLNFLCSLATRRTERPGVDPAIRDTPAAVLLA